MINKLSENQIKMLDVYKEKWLKIGLDTSEIDFNRNQY